MRFAIAILLLTILAGCGSSPKTHYFTLDAISDTGRAQTKLPFPIQVAAVHIPPSLDRRDMVLRTGSNAVDVSGQDRWTAPLGEMTRNILSQDLIARSASGDVILPEAPTPTGTRQIVVAITQFGTDSHGSAILEGSWDLLAGDMAAPVFHHDISLHGPANVRTGEAASAAMSRLLQQLSAQIIAVLARQAGDLSKGS